MRTILAGALIAAGVLMLAVPAHAQDATAAPNDALPRLSELKLADLPGGTGPVRPIVQDPVQNLVKDEDEDENEDEDEGTHDSLKNGTLTGLVVGGIIGAIIAAKCGHPECGPYISIFAGLGAAVGVGLDGLITPRPVASVRAVSATRVRRMPFQRSTTVCVSKRW